MNKISKLNTMILSFPTWISVLVLLKNPTAINQLHQLNSRNEVINMILSEFQDVNHLKL